MTTTNLDEQRKDLLTAVGIGLLAVFVLLLVMLLIDWTLALAALFIAGVMYRTGQKATLVALIDFQEALAVAEAAARARDEQDYQDFIDSLHSEIHSYTRRDSDGEYLE